MPQEQQFILLSTGIYCKEFGPGKSRHGMEQIKHGHCRTPPTLAEIFKVATTLECRSDHAVFVDRPTWEGASREELSNRKFGSTCAMTLVQLSPA